MWLRLRAGCVLLFSGHFLGQGRMEKESVERERGRGREATRKTGQEPKTRREGREKVPGAPRVPTKHPARTPHENLLNDAVNTDRQRNRGDLPRVRRRQCCHSTDQGMGDRSGDRRGSSHAPLTAPGVCSLTPRSGRWTPRGNLGEGGERSSGRWLQGTGRLQPHGHQEPPPQGGGLGRGCVTTLTVSDGRQFQDGVKGAFQVRHLLWKRKAP